MEKLRGKYYIDNGIIKPIYEFSDHTLKSKTVIYEVIRVISGVPLFIEEHLDRLQLSMLLAGWKILPDLIKIRTGISALIHRNRILTGNIKLAVVIHKRIINFYIYFIPHTYPSKADYRNGVEVGLLCAERTNPKAKISQANVRDKANITIEKSNIYEVLLVDNKGFIREGSRSNVFFIIGNQIVTPPENMVLNGITRQKVIQILKEKNYAFTEQQVSVKDLKSFDCIFLTGTSPKVLPIKKIETINYNSTSEICRNIFLDYEQLIRSYISKSLKS